MCSDLLCNMGIHCNVCTSFIHAQEEGRDWARRQGQSLRDRDQAEPVDPERKECAAKCCDTLLVSFGVRQLSFIFICSIGTGLVGTIWYHYNYVYTTGISTNILTSVNVHDPHRVVLMLWEATLNSKSVQYHHIPLPSITISPQLTACGLQAQSRGCIKLGGVKGWPKKWCV